MLYLSMAVFSILFVLLVQSYFVTSPQVWFLAEFTLLEWVLAHFYHISVGSCLQAYSMSFIEKP